MDSIDDEILRMIFQYCNLGIISQVCNKWNYITGHSIMLPHWLAYLSPNALQVFQIIQNNVNILCWNPSAIIEDKVRKMLDLSTVKKPSYVAGFPADL